MMSLSAPATRRRGFVAAALVAALGASLPPATSWAQDGDAEAAENREEASRHFRRGVDLYKDADYVAALVEFKRAYELAPNYRVLYNLGQTSRGLKDYAAALVAYRGYLAEGGDEISKARRKEVEGAVEELVERVGTIEITTNVEGAEIQIDDEVVGKTPLDEAVVVNIGKRRVAATHPGHRNASRVVEVAGRDELTVELNLESLKREDPEPMPVAPPPPPADEGGVPVAGIVGLSITAASGIATAVLGGLALSSRGDLDEELGRFPGDPAALQDAQDQASTLSIATDVMIGVTSAAALTTLVLFLVDPGGSDADEDAPDDEVDVSLAPTPGGLYLHGTF